MTNEEPASRLRTLGELRDHIESLDLPASQKAQMRSAIKRVDALVGHGCLDLPADPRMIMAKVEQLSPAMAGLTKEGFANLKSRLRAAFRVAEPRLKPARSDVRLKGDWLALYESLKKSEQRRLSRFLRIACSRGWNPQDIDDGHIERFRIFLRDETMLGDWERTTRNSIHAWNAVAEKLPEWGLQRLTPPPRKRTSYWRAKDEFPEGFQRDLESFLHHLGSPAGFIASGESLKPNTIKQYGYALISLGSALVASGVPIDELTSICVVVNAGHLERALRHLHERFDKKVTSGMVTMALRAHKAAKWAELPEVEIKKLDTLIAGVKDGLTRKRGLTQKNRELINRLDDQRFFDAVTLLPFSFRDRAETAAKQNVAASYARAAVAVELLLTCGMRRANLVSLELGKTIRKLGSGETAQWIIEFDELDVKNEEPLRFHLEGETVELLEWYLKEWRAKLCPKAPNNWLFPRETGEMMAPRHFSNNIATKCKRELGVRMTMHQFRHISAEIYLCDNPEGLGTISQHFAHRDGNTTRNYYARSKQREASRRYQSHFMAKREESAARQRPPRRRRRIRREVPVDEVFLEEREVDWL